MSCGPATRTASGWRSAVFVVVMVTTASSWAQPDDSLPDTDLRGVRVGMLASELPRSGFAGFACATGPAIALTGFDRWRECPADADGRHALRFGYDPASAREGTRVAGHPAILTLRVAGDGRVEGLRIETDPDARLFARKKAFLFGVQARSRYGEDGWRCEEGKPRAGEEPVGGVFIRERCVKHIADRAVHIERSLYRRADQDIGHFVGSTRIDIEWTPG